MPVTASCPSCSATLRVASHAAGRKIQCPECGKPFRVADEPMVEVVEPGRRKGGSFKVLLGLAIVVALGVGAYSWVKSMAQESLKEGDALWAAGKRDEAVEKYRKSFLFAEAKDKGELIKRIA